VILADTSIWIDYFRQVTGEHTRKFAECIESRSIIALSAVFGELLQGVKNDKEEKVILEHWNFLPRVDEENLFIEAGKISHYNKLYNRGVGLIDCYILAAAKRHKLEIWSLDKKLIQAGQLINL